MYLNHLRYFVNELFVNDLYRTLELHCFMMQIYEILVKQNCCIIMNLFHNNSVKGVKLLMRLSFQTFLRFDT